jgi:hypothetical protein
MTRRFKRGGRTGGNPHACEATPLYTRSPETTAAAAEACCATLTASVPHCHSHQSKLIGGHRRSGRCGGTWEKGGGAQPVLWKDVSPRGCGVGPRCLVSRSTPSGEKKRSSLCVPLSIVGEGETERERQRDRETERQRDRETERQRGRETERQTVTVCVCVCVWRLCVSVCVCVGGCS